jgi:iron-sulfur cluster repair protein YtfE (RIC family)
MDQLSTTPISGVTSSTPVRSKRLSVNAAFLKDIKDDNRELKALIDRLYPLVEHPQVSSNHWNELQGLLADLRDQLAVHFSLEEAYGYFEDAIETAPRISLKAEQLRGDHARLFEWIRDLADRVLEVEADSIEKISRFVDHFQRFRSAFEQHETAEVELILQAMDDDLGVGD